MTKPIGEYTVKEMIPHLEPIAKRYGLRLNRIKEFRIVKMLFATLHY